MTMTYGRVELDAAIADVDARLAEARGRYDNATTEILGLARKHGYSIASGDSLQTALDDGSIPAGVRKALERYLVGWAKANEAGEALAVERDALIGQRDQHDAVLRHAKLGHVERSGSGAAAITHRPHRASGGSSPVTTTPISASGDPQRRAFAVIEHHLGAATGPTLTPAAADRLDRIVRAEPLPANARYIAAVGSPDYASAWSKVMADKDRAAIELDAVERAALREAHEALVQLNFMTLGTLDVEPGWPLPIQVDPTLIITGAGAQDPLRQLATVRTIIAKSQTVVTAAQVTAGYGAEGTNVTAVSPAPEPVEITAERGSAFVKLTYELVADFRGSASEIGRIIADAKRNLEAEKFAIGTGTNEPHGIVSGLSAFAGAPSDPDDLRAVQNDLGARYQGNASWLANLAMLNTVSTFVASADADEPQIFDAAGNLLRKPPFEVSYFPDATVVYGDVRAGFTIVDRLGLSLEPTGVTFHSSGVPDGHRGFLALWRSGSSVVDAAALRLLGVATGS